MWLFEKAWLNLKKKQKSDLLLESTQKQAAGYKLRTNQRVPGNKAR